MKHKHYLILSVFCIVFALSSVAQDAVVTGYLSDKKGAVAFADIFLKGENIGVTTDESGKYTLNSLPSGDHIIIVSAHHYERIEKKISLKSDSYITLNFELKAKVQQIDQVVISGTMKAVSKSDSPVPIEVYSAAFFKANPTPSVYEALQNVNGVRPQINCAVCNTGDIHINGLEGPYTMVLIDGMPIVSGLSTVYGLSGIPQSLIERVEVVKGPASTLYGSEAVGGVINVITKKTNNAPIISADVFGTTWGEINADVATKLKVGKKAEALIGLNHFNFNQRIDNDNDNFTDVTLQNRTSIFNKWNFKRKNNRILTLAGRYVYEDRFGGDLDWTTEFRGGDVIYGESIYTSRWEVFGTYQLPVKERVLLQFSANEHDQNSVYGDTKYIADQKIAFGQLTWDKKLGEKHDVFAGLTMRYTYYDDNTPATATLDTVNLGNLPTRTYLPGIFIQDQITFNAQNKILLGMRYDYNSIHGNIYTPRINYKWNSENKKNILRLSAGSGYRVANVFTEDHAALTGSREVVLLSDLSPETSYNGNINYVKKIFTKKNLILGIDASAFYTYFNNKIFPDYESDPSLIIYDNLTGYAVSQGVTVNFDVSCRDLKLNAGVTMMDVYNVQDGIRERQVLTERFTGTWSIGYNFDKIQMSINYTGNVYSPMDLPTQTTDIFTDPRPAESPWFSIQNIQVTKGFGKRLEVYGGVKNLLNWTPWNSLNGLPYLGNTADPFEQNTPPNSLVFDPAYVYGPNQGIRGFLGVRYTFD
jgi:outer membrane receptor for ferrienterochelin and colicins